LIRRKDRPAAGCYAGHMNAPIDPLLRYADQSLPSPQGMFVSGTGAMPFASRIRFTAQGHAEWRAGLRRLVLEARPGMEPEEMAREDACAFGRWWLSPEVPGVLRCSPAAREVERYHADLHACACAALRKAALGDRTGALADLGPGGALARADAALAEALAAWEGELHGVAA
jgi:hypothetical protein